MATDTRGMLSKRGTPGGWTTGYGISALRDSHAHRQAVARFGERLAGRFLEERGGRILGRNLRVGRGEIDLHAAVNGVPVAVEVKTLIAVSDRDDALAAFTEEKAATVRRYGRRLKPAAHRVDVVAVTVRPKRVDVHWVPYAG